MYFNKKTSKMSSEQVKKYCMRLEFDLDELKSFLSCEEKYPRFNSFNENIIVPMLEELNDKNFYNVAIEKISENKKVRKLMFFVSLGARNQKLKNIKQKEQAKEKDIISVILDEDYSISDIMIKDILNNNQLSYIKETLKYIQENDVDSPKEFLIDKLLPERKNNISNEEKYAFLQSL